MTTEYILDQLILHGEKMRTAQKNFFSTRSYEAEKKQGYYTESKVAEGQFDLLLKQAKIILKKKP